MIYSYFHRCFLASVFIGVFFICFNSRTWAENKEQLTFDKPDNIEKRMNNDNQLYLDRLVEIEPLYINPSIKNTNYELLDYQNRRAEDGVSFSIQYSFYEPVFYQPQFSVSTFGDIYGSKEGAAYDIKVSKKSNYSFMSLSYDVAVSYYKVESINESVSADFSTLQLIPVQVGATITFDTWFREPYFAPFIGAGAYLVYFEEEQNNNPKYSGNTQPAPYINFGFLVQLNWIDKNTSRLAYIESGIQNTSLIVEGKKYFTSSNGIDPDLETDIHPSVGVHMEF